MLEEAIPALLSAVHGWFTPAVLFVVLNIVIGTIAVTSKAAAASETGGEEEENIAAAGAGWEQHRRLARVTSMAFERLRSFNGRFAAAAPEPDPAEAGVVDLGHEQPPAAEMEKEDPVVVEPEPEPEPEPEHAARMERSRSEAEAELPRLPARLHKSASDKSAFAHFGAEEVEQTARAVEARRPATTRETRGRRRFPVAEPESSESESDSEEEEEAISGGEVDARADDFINRFRHQLKLQRIDSFIRHRETVRRGQAQAAARGV
ncbi:unnamed protein product [Miscanthus lutarioriparius]|uniref:DUF4408 domain-containing protein n=1 Tax=Miscanthus lutarioriparius TaxID=422564 RepID=A0A811SCK1_9POAL|nr:unnamed protein product [Miscanthus lutarioriparius]